MFGALRDSSRPKDLSRLLDLLEQRALTDGAIEAIADVTRVGIAGHSFGGFTSLYMISPGGLGHAWDERLDVSVPIAPAIEPLELFGADVASITAPTFYIGGTDDGHVSFEQQLLPGYLAQRSPKGLAEIVDAGHLSFTNMCEEALIEAARRLGIAAEWEEKLRDGCGRYA